ncbi:hypothetical protein EK21DRAFT_87078 [Setomelanomma holmii]|uniref:Uncharacterized protein n=1 Tax=Setomelanomma holmii TaxID=210430 RepID=A0A9P4HF76_9PLEO|nr:hypothetical protein EK21DRAFT_87078 [Setomelanomma holmii]
MFTQAQEPCEVRPSEINGNFRPPHTEQGCRNRNTGSGVLNATSISKASNAPRVLIKTCQSLHKLLYSRLITISGTRHHGVPWRQLLGPWSGAGWFDQDQRRDSRWVSVCHQGMSGRGIDRGNWPTVGAEFTIVPPWAGFWAQPRNSRGASFDNHSGTHVACDPCSTAHTLNAPPCTTIVGVEMRPLSYDECMSVLAMADECQRQQLLMRKRGATCEK